MSFRSNLILSALALSLPLAATQANAASNANSLTCKLAPPNAVITNGTSASLPAGTKIVVRIYPAPSVVGPTLQKVMFLKSDLSPGVDTSLKGDLSAIYQTCTARVAS